MPERSHLDRITRAQQRAASLDVSPAKLAAEIERVVSERDAARREADAARRDAEAARADLERGAASSEELETARRERDQYVAALQRERAEFLNFKRRTAEEREAMLGLAAEGLIRKVLALADDFDRAVEHRPDAIADEPWVEGIAAIDRKLRQLLESEGVTPIDASPGIRFDPRDHEAVTNVPGSGRRGGEIVEELRRGYRLRDRVLRPALVAVAEDSPAETAGESDPATPPNPTTGPIH
jgi:molecular chaperone GrpE